MSEKKKAEPSIEELERLLKGEPGEKDGPRDDDTIAYIQLKSPADMAHIAAEMIRYASENPFDMERAMKEAKQAGAGINKEGQVVVKDAHKRIPWMEKYNRYVTFDGQTPTQITYTISDMKEWIVQHLTIINNDKTPLDDNVMGRIVGWFITGQEDCHSPKTPDHVLSVLVRRKKATDGGK